MRGAGGAVSETVECEVVRRFFGEAVCGVAAKAYYLRSIHEHLPPQARKQLKGSGLDEWAGASQIGQAGRARTPIAQPGCTGHVEMPKEQFKQEVEKELTRRETEPWEIIYFKLWQGRHSRNPSVLE